MRTANGEPSEALHPPRLLGPGAARALRALPEHTACEVLGPLLVARPPALPEATLLLRPRFGIAVRRLGLTVSVCVEADG